MQHSTHNENKLSSFNGHAITLTLETKTMIKEMDSIVEVTLLKCSSSYRQSSTRQPGDGSELLVSQ